MGPSSFVASSTRHWSLNAEAPRWWMWSKEGQRSKSVEHSHYAQCFRGWWSASSSLLDDDDAVDEWVRLRVEPPLTVSVVLRRRVGAQMMKCRQWRTRMASAAQ